MIKVSRREKYALWAAAGFVGLFLAMQFVVFPLLDRETRLQRAIVAKTGALGEMQTLKAEHDRLKAQADASRVQFERRDQGFTLFSFLDQLAGQTGVKDRIVYMKPSSTLTKNSPYKVSTVEMKLQAITLQQMTQYLYQVETSANRVTVRRVSISKNEKQQGVVDAILQAETFEPA